MKAPAVVYEMSDDSSFCSEVDENDSSFVMIETPRATTFSLVEADESVVGLSPASCGLPSLSIMLIACFLIVAALLFWLFITMPFSKWLSMSAVRYS